MVPQTTAQVKTRNLIGQRSKVWVWPAMPYHISNQFVTCYIKPGLFVLSLHQKCRNSPPSLGQNLAAPNHLPLCMWQSCVAKWKSVAIYFENKSKGKALRIIQQAFAWKSKWVWPNKWREDYLVPTWAWKITCQHLMLRVSNLIMGHKCPRLL